MRTDRHVLTPIAPGTTRELLSLHFGPTASGRKVLIQAALHADEPPGLLVAFHLRRELLALESRGLLLGEIVLLPLANPIGLAQRLLGRPLGRFELGSGENFNRNYPDVAQRAFELLRPTLSAGRVPDLSEVRAALRLACAELPASSELASLRKTLLGLAIDADLLLDLHCDNEAVMHLYTGTAVWPQVEPLARLLGAEISLLADESGGEPFDESCARVWERLNALYSAQTGLTAAWPQACVAVTVELRGECEVEHALARRDAQAILDYLIVSGFINAPQPELPALRRAARPLAGSLPIVAPRAGLLVHRVSPGAEVRRGEVIAELIDPLTAEVLELTSPVDGLLYAREIVRMVQAGMSVAKVAGSESLRHGKLLSA